MHTGRGLASLGRMLSPYSFKIPEAYGFDQRRKAASARQPLPPRAVGPPKGTASRPLAVWLAR
jgi:hypothetical protein